LAFLAADFDFADFFAADLDFEALLAEYDLDVRPLCAAANVVPASSENATTTVKRYLNFPTIRW